MAEKQVIVKGQFKDEISGGMTRMGQNVVSNLKGMAIGFGAGLVSVQAFKAGIVDSVKAAVEEERQINRLNAVLNSHRGSVQSSAGALSDWAETQMRVTGISDDAYRSALALSIGLGRTEEEAKRLATTAADASVVLGRDMGGVVEALNKSYGGNLRELRVLIPELGSLSNEALRAGGAVDELSKRMGGAAAGANVGMAGATLNLKNSIGELKESFGSLLLGGAENAQIMAEQLEVLRQRIDDLGKSAMKPGLAAFLRGISVVPGMGQFGNFGGGGLSNRTQVARAQGLSDAFTRANASPSDPFAVSNTPRQFYHDKEEEDAAKKAADKALEAYKHTVEFTRDLFESVYENWRKVDLPQNIRSGTKWTKDELKDKVNFDFTPAEDTAWQESNKNEKERRRQFEEDRDRAVAATSQVMGAWTDGFAQAIRAGDGFFGAVSSGFEALASEIQRMLLNIAIEAAARKVVSLIPGLGSLSEGGTDMGVTPTISMRYRRAVRAAGLEMSRSAARGHI